MKIYHNFKDCPSSSCSTAITVGNFDGVHLGHQTLLKYLVGQAQRSIVLTFSNHPSEILYGSSIAYLTTLSHRLTLFEQWGVDEVILIPFTADFAKQTAKIFLQKLKKKFPQFHLILGHDAVLGSDRQKQLHTYAEQMYFTVEYLTPVCIDDKIVSSSEIRKYIQQGKLIESSYLLGRPYSIFTTVEKGAGQGGSLGFHTANLPVEKLALPPLGVYAVEVTFQQERYLAIGNLGHAPTLHQNRPIFLEVHLLDAQKLLYHQKIEVTFLQFIRSERRFANRSELKEQILKDVEHTRKIFKNERDFNLHHPAQS